jgi:hypothetical protein
MSEMSIQKIKNCMKILSYIFRLLGVGAVASSRVTVVVLFTGPLRRHFDCLQVFFRQEKPELLESKGGKVFFAWLKSPLSC